MENKEKEIEKTVERANDILDKNGTLTKLIAAKVVAIIMLSMLISTCINVYCSGFDLTRILAIAVLTACSAFFEFEYFRKTMEYATIKVMLRWVQDIADVVDESFEKK